MKKKLLFTLTLVCLFVFLFTLAISAEEKNQYVEFKVMLAGDTEYTTVYTVNSHDTWNPGITMSYDFYTDSERTVVLDKTQIVILDLSEPVVHTLDATAAPVRQSTITRLVGDANNPLTNVTHIYLPKKVDTVPNNMCKGWTSLTTVDFGGATKISDSAFENCTFTEFTVPAQITQFNNNAFKGCASLQKLTVLGNANFGSGVFQNCTSLTDVNLVQPQIIGSSMFQGCSSLTGITIPEGVTEIGACAFMGTQISTLHVPSTVTKIGYQVAENVTTLKSITFAENSQLTFIAHRTFQGSGLNGDIVIPESVTTIDYNAFASTVITSVTLPSTLETIGNSVFDGCTGLTEVTIPDAVTTLGQAAFKGCSNLKRVNISANSQISNKWISIFRGCTKLESVFVPPLVTEIGYDNFWDCTALTEITFSEGLKNISGGNNFNTCTALEKIEFPNSLTNIGGSNFADCTSLKEIRFGNGLVTLGDGNLTLKKLEKVYLPASLTSIGAHILGYSSANDSSNNITFIFTGTKAQAEALQLALKEYTEANASGHAPNSSKFYDATLVSATEYDADTTAPSDFHLVYDYSACKAFYNNVHKDKAPTYDFCGQKYISDLYEYIGCERCNVVTEKKAGEAVFTSRGYSKDETNGSIMYDLIVNYTAIANYEEKAGATLTFGLVVSGNSALTSLIDGDEEIASEDVLKIKFGDTQYTKLQIKITNIGTDTTAKVHACAYVIESKDETKAISYIGNGVTTSTSTAISYGEIPSSEE
ncbi:MAG: leucine-rich repeat protein [Clostridia bacterium]|nr:leucine-rich repeat protein [Clostridia bacterium]